MNLVPRASDQDGMLVWGPAPSSVRRSGSPDLKGNAWERGRTSGTCAHYFYVQCVSMYSCSCHRRKRYGRYGFGCTIFGTEIMRGRNIRGSEEFFEIFVVLHWTLLTATVDCSLYLSGGGTGGAGGQSPLQKLTWGRGAHAMYVLTKVT